MKKNNNLIIIIILVVIGFVWAYNSGYIEIPSTLNSNERFQNDNYCTENIIPPKIAINEGAATIDKFRMGYNLPEFADSWKDGQAITSQKEEGSISDDFMNTHLSFACHQGFKEGENVNYLYCKDLQYSKTTQEINSEGVLGKKVEKNYNIDLVLKPEGKWEFIEGFSLQSGDNLNKSLAELGRYLGNDGYLQTYGDVWVEKDKHFNYYNIYRNYSIISYKCKKN